MDPNQSAPQPQPIQPANPQPMQPTGPLPPVQPVPSTSKLPAFMYPEANLPDQEPSPKKSKKGLVVILAVVLVLVIGGGVAALVLGKKSKTTGGSSGTATNNQSNNQTNGSSSDATYKLTDSVKLSAAPTIIQGSLADGWSTDTTNQGLNGIVHSSGCKIYFTQSTERTVTDSSDQSATDTVIQSMVDELKKTGTVSDQQTGSVKLRVDGSTDTIEFKQVTLTYATDLTEHKVITTLRNIDGYTIGTRFYCSTSSFSSNLNQQVLDTVTIKLPKASS